MAEGDVVTYFADGRWRNRIEGAPGFLDEHATLEEALAAGERRAAEMEVPHRRPRSLPRPLSATGQD